MKIRSSRTELGYPVIEVGKPGGTSKGFGEESARDGRKATWAFWIWEPRQRNDPQGWCCPQVSKLNLKN